MSLVTSLFKSPGSTFVNGRDINIQIDIYNSPTEPAAPPLPIERH